MYISKIKLINFRNYNTLEITLDEKLNIFVGNNAQGKTNILESIFVTGFGKSFRTNRDRELINMDKEKSYIKIEGEKKHTDISIELKLWNNRKKEIKVNGIGLNKLSDILGNINVVIFSPEDLKLIKDGPVERRKFIDREISHISKKYYYNLISYNKVLYQRNNLLKKIDYNKGLKDTIDIWNEKLLEFGVELIIKRRQFIYRINSLSRLMHRKITDGRENLEVRYLSNIKIDNKDEYKEIYKKFKDKLQNSLDKDIQRGYTGYGPHKDDVGLYINDIDIRNFGSQGQQRTVALSLKLSEIEIVKAEIGEYPILLLDDVMSELDINRQRFLIKNLQNVQTIITMTEIPELMKTYISNAKVFTINNGEVSSYSY